MGYESKIYIVKKSSCTLLTEGNKVYAQEIASFDLCKVYSISTVLQKMPKTDCYFYDYNAHRRVFEDMYGEELTECSVTYLADLIQKEIDDGDDYWRYPLILATLRELEKLNDSNIVCLHYGY